MKYFPPTVTGPQSVRKAPSMVALTAYYGIPITEPSAWLHRSANSAVKSNLQVSAAISDFNDFRGQFSSQCLDR